ncbi:c-type cytochrome [Methylobacillus sp. Pita1]|uniref:c-type cytochrome n=1 Tax=Methylobacillus sp. Pita1 TaxID=3382642 RepID=UPI0038B68F35
MNKLFVVLLVAQGILAATAHAADAKAAQSLVQKSGCLACHGVEKKIVGPGYKEVAEKYKNDKAAEAKLIAKIKTGGGGTWGQMPMPPNAHVKEEDIKTIVSWILSL